MEGNADTGALIRVLLADDHAMFRQGLTGVALLAGHEPHRAGLLQGQGAPAAG
jgi:hypothetical protein